MNKKTHLSFIILTWNSQKHISMCLSSIMKSLDTGRFIIDIYIIDNGSTDASVSIINNFKTKYPEIINPIFLEKNTGTTYSRNLALKRATGDYIVIMDSDVEINERTIDELLGTFIDDQNIGMVVPKLVYGNGNLQKSTDNFPTIWRKLYRYFFLKQLEEKENRDPIDTNTKTVDYAISAFWMLKRKIVDDVGLLDENIFYAPEDVDYCLRVWKNGYKILYYPGAYAIHYAQEISRGFRLNKATIEHIKGLLYYFKKHRYFFIKPSFPIN